MFWIGRHDLRNFQLCFRIKFDTSVVLSSPMPALHSVKLDLLHFSTLTISCSENQLSIPSLCYYVKSFVTSPFALSLVSIASSALCSEISPICVHYIILTTMRTQFSNVIREGLNSGEVLDFFRKVLWPNLSRGINCLECFWWISLAPQEIFQSGYW
jgi:hypothetical protein